MTDKKKKAYIITEKKLEQALLEAQYAQLIAMFTASLPPALSEDEVLNAIIMQRNLLFSVQAGNMASFAS